MDNQNSISTPSNSQADSHPWSEALISDVVAKINEKGIVPVIGYGVFYAEEDGKVYPVQEYIVRCVIKHVSNDFKVQTDEMTKYFSGIKGMTALSRDLGKAKLKLKAILATLYRDKGFYEKIRIAEEVQTFLRNGQFPLIISTVNFGFITSILGNLGLKYDLVSYQAESSEDIELNKKEIATYTIMNLFGSVSNMSYSVVTESDFLHCLHKLHDKDFTAKNLKTYLAKRYILSLGCEVPDWTFRFLLYSLKVDDKSESLKDDDGGDNSFVGGSISELFEDDLTDFLKDINYQFSQNRTNTLKRISQELHPENRIKVFLSLSSSDYDNIGERLKDILKEKYDVWMFKYDGGIQYWNDIKEGIRQCRYFVPVITGIAAYKLAMLKDADNIVADEASGLIYEWTLALKNMRENHYVEQKQIYSIPFFKDVPQEDFKKTLSEKDTNKDKLWPLFYSGTKAIIGDFTLEEFDEYIKQEDK